MLGGLVCSGQWFLFILFLMGLGCHLMEDIVCDSNAVQVLNSELSRKTYWWGLRSQEVGEEGDCT